MEQTYIKGMALVTSFMAGFALSFMAGQYIYKKMGLTRFFELRQKLVLIAAIMLAVSALLKVIFYALGWPVFW